MGIAEFGQFRHNARPCSDCTGAIDTRVAQLVDGGGMTNAAAAKSVRDSDGARRDYLRRFYDIKEAQPTHDELVLNTGTLSLASAAALIVAAAPA